MKANPFDTIGYLLKRTQQALRNKMDDELRPLGLTVSQYVALSVLERETGLSNAELSRRCFVTPQTMHQILVGMEKSSLLERTAHPEHGRIQHVKLSSKGQSMLRQAHAHVAAVEKRMVADLNQAEKVRLRKILVKCSEALENEG